MNQRFSFFVHVVFAVLGASVFSFAVDIPGEGLVAYYPFNGTFENEAAGASAVQVEKSVNHGAAFGVDRFGNALSSAYFDGDSSYLEIPDNDAFSIATTGALTISVWMSPDSVDFVNAERAGYVHWMGKGVPHQHEWVFRMYNGNLSSDQENRPNRMSAYAFNLEGGLGAGSYVQEEISPREWIHFVARYDVSANKISLFKNGVMKDEDDLYDATYGVQVQNGTAPVRLGTRSLWSFFKGRIDDLRFYNRILSEDEIVALYNEADPAESQRESSPCLEKKVSGNSRGERADIYLMRHGSVCAVKGKAHFDFNGRRVH